MEEWDSLKLQYLSANLNHTSVLDPQAACSGERKVKDAVADVWPAVGNLNHDRFMGRKVCDANFGAERQTAVGRSWLVPIERGAVRCLSRAVRIKRGLSGKDLVTNAWPVF
jgi:hypothetical protein